MTTTNSAPQSVPATWNTWDVRCLNAVMKLPEMVEVRVIVYDSEKRSIHDELRWDAAVTLGPHSLNGDFSEVTLRYREAIFTLTFAADGNQFAYKITPDQPTPYLHFFIAGLLRWNRPGCIESRADSLHLHSGNTSHIITILGQRADLPINTTYQGILVDGRELVYIRGNHTLSPAEMEGFIAEKRAQWAANAHSGGGLLADAPEAMLRGLLWNTIYEPIKNRICSPVTREWCIVKPERPWFGSFVLFVWDTCFNALMAAGQDESLAYLQLYSLLQGMVKGMVPLLDSEINVYDDRSQPPVGAYVALKLFQQHGRIQFLQEIFDDLLSWHRWWLPHRDGNGDGLLEWGTNLPITHNDYAGYLSVAKCESGLDNSPMYDDTTFNPNTHTMELTDVGLSALYALDAWALAEIGEILGRAETAELRAEYEEMSRLIQQELWNEELGIFCNKHWHGRFSTTLSPTNFYPMLAGIATPAQCQRMVEEHLLNEAEFWGEFVIPTSTRNHPSFADNDYWRGRIWAPTNFLVYEGLRRNGFDEIAAAVAQKSLNLFLGEWQAENHIHENYNTLTGDGDDVENADPVYTWGGLLAYIAANEYLFVEPDGGLTMGSLADTAVALRHFAAHNGRYTLSQNHDLTVWYNSRFLLHSSVPLRLTHFPPAGPVWRLVIRQCQPGELTLHPPLGITEIEIVYQGHRQTVPCVQQTAVTITLP